ncbi:MAG: MucB/RseB C-terminal domain-containing protein [Parashewanella sp.]
MRFIILLLSAVVFPVFAQDEWSASAWLEKMSQALRNEQFKASMIQIEANHIRPLVYLHGNVENQEVAFLEYLNGPTQKMVRVGNQVTFLSHEQTAYSVFSPRIEGLWPAVFSDDPHKLSESYQFVLGGRARIAGRSGQLVRLIPVDKYRYGYQLWLDMQNYLPLRFETISNDKVLLEQLMTIEMLELNNTPKVLVDAAKRDWPEATSLIERKEGKNWQFNWLPKGFEVVMRDHHQLLGSTKRVEYIALTDGIANISVYVGSADETDLPDELTSRNGLSVITTQKGNAEIVVVGKAPAETLNHIANNISLKE